MAENEAPEKIWITESMAVEVQGLPELKDTGIEGGWWVRERADLAAPDAGAWLKEFPANPGYYWIRMLGSPDNGVIAFISRNLIHYTNGEKERGELCGGKYEFLGPLSPT